MTNDPTFEGWVAGWNDVADNNMRSIGDGWNLAAEAIVLHRDALEEIRTSNKATETQKRAIVLLGVHMARSFGAGLGLTARGIFDAAPYVMRGLYDTQSLLLGCILLDESFATDVLDGKKKNLPATARKELVDAMRAAGNTELADDLDDRFNRDRNAGNGLAHTNAYHLVRVRGPLPDGSWAPTFDGFHLESEAKVLCAGMLEIEDWALRWFSIFGDDFLSESWKQRHEQFDIREDAYRTEVSALMHSLGTSDK